MNKVLEAWERIQETCSWADGDSDKREVGDNALIQAVIDAHTKDYGITLSKYAKYDEHAEKDYMVYEVKYPTGRKEYLSREIFNILAELLGSK